MSAARVLSAVLVAGLAGCTHDDDSGLQADTGEGWSTVVIEGPFIEIDSDGTGLCVLDDGGIARCFGYVAEPHDVSIHNLSVGYGAGCGLDVLGALICWGDESGEIPLGSGFLDVDVGTAASCAITATGAPICWGGWPEEPPTGEFQQVAVFAGTTYAAVNPEGLTFWGSPDAMDLVPGSFVGLFADVFPCAVTNTRAVWCYGPLPDDSWLITEDAEMAAIEGGTVCWTSGGDVRCAGVFEGAGDYRLLEAPLHKPAAYFARVAPMIGALCGLTDEGELMCWSDERTTLEDYFPDEAGSR